MRANSALQMKFAAKGAYSLQIYTNFMKQPVLILRFPKNSFVFWLFDFVFLGLMGILGYMGLNISDLSLFSSDQKFFSSELFAPIRWVNIYIPKKTENLD